MLTPGCRISEAHLQKVMGYVQRARNNGGKLLIGGEQLSPSAGLTGNFVVPTIFDEVTAGNELFSDEVFGPVLAVTRFDRVEDAIRLANNTRYGLANSIWTSDLAAAMTASRRLESGLVWVNTTLDGAPQLPFGGMKASGFGRELGKVGFDDFTELKTVLLSSAPFASAFPGALQ
jgi:betaine-aldehyde dehydrogenase